jgi:hypothetical protein
MLTVVKSYPGSLEVVSLRGTDRVPTLGKIHAAVGVAVSKGPVE